MTPNLDTLLKLAEAATSGPWVKGHESGQCHKKHQHDVKSCVYEYRIREGSGFVVPRGKEQPITLIGYDDTGEILSAEDSAFIAAANPSTVIDMIKTIRDLEQQVKRWQDKEVERASCCDFNEQLAAKYRDALEKISSGNCPSDDGCGGTYFWEIAREALKSE
jgi:hypothetical protein